MLDEKMLEKRLTMLEQTVVQLQQRFEQRPASENWLTALSGSISDESTLLQALEHGRAFRQADKPTDDAIPSA
ncbi:MAG: transferase hexapeptide repeat containing protein [Cyanobacteria bacterium P01_A01_bin.116]